MRDEPRAPGDGYDEAGAATESWEIDLGDRKVEENQPILEQPPASRESLAAGLAKASQLGVAMLANLLVGFVIGTALDRFFGTSPWLLFIFLLFGVVAGFISMFKIAMGRYR